MHIFLHETAAIAGTSRENIIMADRRAFELGLKTTFFNSSTRLNLGHIVKEFVISRNAIQSCS